jgi:hypothetical protein
MVILRVMQEEGWGQRLSGDERKRCLAIRKFFNEVMSLNCGLAVNDMPPSDFNATLAIWIRTVSAFSTSHLVAGTSTSDGAGHKPANRGNGNAGRGGGTTGRGNAASASGGRGGRRSGRGNAPQGTPAARVQGIECCWPFNSAAGCSRQQGPNPLTCKHGTYAVFTHYCNFWDTNTNAYCLLQHSKAAAH